MVPLLFRVPDGLELMTDTSSADADVRRLVPWGSGDARVDSLVPIGFEAYARIFHPSWGGGTWAELAGKRGVEIGPETGFRALLAPEIVPEVSPEWEDVVPSDGRLPPEQIESLAAVLAPFTSSGQDCRYCLWNGFGQLWSHAHGTAIMGRTPQELADYERRGEEQDRILRATSLVRIPWREYFLFRGPLDAVVPFTRWCDQSPNIWWPGMSPGGWPPRSTASRPMWAAPEDASTRCSGNPGWKRWR